MRRCFQVFPGVFVCFYLEEVATKSPSSSRSLQNRTPFTKGTAVSSSRVSWVWNLNFFFFTKKAIFFFVFTSRPTRGGRDAVKQEPNVEENVASSRCFHANSASPEMNQHRNLKTNPGFSFDNVNKRWRKGAVCGLKVVKDVPGDISGPVSPVSGGSTTENDRKRRFRSVLSPRGGTLSLSIKLAESRSCDFRLDLSQ